MDEPLSNPNSINPAQSLMLDHIRSEPDQRILILEGGSGWLAREIARMVPEGLVATYDRDFRNQKLAQVNLGSSPNAVAEPQPLPEQNAWDQVLLTIPKERSFARLLLIKAFNLLCQEGELLLAGPSRRGAKAVMKDAQRLFGNAFVLGYRSHQRIARCYKKGKLPTPLPKEFSTPGIAPDQSHTFRVETRAGFLSISSCPGIFSWKKIDIGTRLLLNHLDIEKGKIVWDVGCGYGILGFAAALAGAKTVFMNDVNTLALDYAHRNALANGLHQKTQIFPADGLTFPDNVNFFPQVDLILSNPAFHQGRDVDTSMAHHLVNQAPSLLKPKGRLLLVANRFLNYDNTMKTRFSQVRKIVENNHFHIIEGIKS